MLAKLSFRNAKRQAHDYIIYFVTLTAIFSLIHGLNSLLFAEDDIFPLDDSTFILPMIPNFFAAIFHFAVADKLYD